MPNTSDLDKIAANIRAAAKDCDAMIIETALSLETETIPVATVDCAIFSKLIGHLHPRLVYLIPVAFKSTEDTEVSLEDQEEAALGSVDKEDSQIG